MKDLIRGDAVFLFAFAQIDQAMQDQLGGGKGEGTRYQPDPARMNDAVRAQRGDPITATKNSETRRMPIISDMEQLLNRLKNNHGTTGKELILKVSRGHESLARACKDIGIPRLTHHDFRHLFATRCIESGVDIPTVSRWLGHKDGGALAMKTYGHLRNEHSQAMAQKVKF